MLLALRGSLALRINVHRELAKLGRLDPTSSISCNSTSLANNDMDSAVEMRDELALADSAVQGTIDRNFGFSTPASTHAFMVNTPAVQAPWF